MRAGIENWLVRHWYDTRRPPWYLRVLESLYRIAFLRVQKKQNTAVVHCHPALPLIVVGNITAGGSGKTPLVIRLCQIASDMNLKPGIASTGYGRQGSDTRVVTADSDPRLCGDEPVLLARRTGALVVVAKRRPDAINRLAEMKLDLIISDDGLQHTGLQRDMEFCVVDGARGLGNGHLLPAGPLREPAGRLRLVDYVVANGPWSNKPADIGVTQMQLTAAKLCSLDGAISLYANQFLQKYTGKNIHAFAGIGNPNRFFATLQSLGIDAVTHVFRDHHLFTRMDFASIMPDSVIVMTEKDAVKCASLGLANAWYVPVDTRLPEEFENEFKDRLAKLIKER